MTRQQAYIKHYKMWDEIVENPELDKEKTEICKKQEARGDFPYSCFLCVVHNNDDECTKCPLHLEAGINCHAQTNENKNWWGTFYGTTRTAYSRAEIKNRKQLAEKIRDCVLPYLTEKSKGVISK
jgi:fructosamine-3-kinase